MPNELKRSVVELCDLIDQHAAAQNSGSSLCAFLGPSLDDVREKARELRKQIMGDRNAE